ncbi:hypothetical protein QTN25_003749 [Entamoeba marina]
MQTANHFSMSRFNTGLSNTSVVRHSQLGDDVCHQRNCVINTHGFHDEYFDPFDDDCFESDEEIRSILFGGEYTKIEENFIVVGEGSVINYDAFQ